MGGLERKGRVAEAKIWPDNISIKGRTGEDLAITFLTAHFRVCLLIGQ